MQGDTWLPTQEALCCVEFVGWWVSELVSYTVTFRCVLYHLHELYIVEMVRLSQHFSVQQLILRVITVQFASAFAFGVPLQRQSAVLAGWWLLHDTWSVNTCTLPVQSASVTEVCKVSFSYDVHLFCVSWGSEQLAVTDFRLVLEETTVNIKAANSSKASVTVYQSTYRHIPEDFESSVRCFTRSNEV